MNLIIYGSSGVGKTTIANLLKLTSTTVDIVKIYTNREQRPSEIFNCIDYNFISKQDFKIQDYPVNFQKFGNQYGIHSNDITNMIKQKKDFITIIGDIDACIKLKQVTNQYQDITNLIYLYADNTTIMNRLQSRGEKNITKRMTSVYKDFNDYANNISNFDAVIFNDREIDKTINQFQILYKVGDVNEARI